MAAGMEGISLLMAFRSSSGPKIDVVCMANVMVYLCAEGRMCQIIEALCTAADMPSMNL